MQDNELHELIADAERYCAEAGIKLSTLGQYALGNKRWFDDRRAGRPCLTSTVERLRSYLADKRRENAA